ncbi:energy transducer TonB [Aliifodinibius sp. S!AR15-10]|nr:energy transducer TonB [Aliifodinibius sp. S!AR15-10]
MEGKVNVWFLVTEMGKPECFKVLNTSDPSLSKSVIDALHEVNYIPANSDGELIERPLSISFIFRNPDKSSGNERFKPSLYPL